MHYSPQTPGKKLTSTAICERYGITRRTLGRWMADPDMSLPKPLTLNFRHYWEELEIIEWERTRAASKLKAA